MLDILIIGSGGAGLSAALSAKLYTNKILVVSKTYPTQSQTVQAQGGINAVLSNSSDSVLNHIEDTAISSKNLSNKEAIKFMCENAKDTITWLDKLGVPFSRDDNCEIKQRYFGGTKYKRTCFSSDFTGLKIMHTLYDNCIKEKINFLNEQILIELLKDEKQSVIGAKFLDIKTTSITKIYAKKTIIASGGYSNIYHNFTTNSTSTTGDGIAEAFKAGAKLSNMEFVQFHPTALINSNTLLSEAARAHGAYLVDENENRFVDELATRDVVSREIKLKLLENKRVFLDMRHIDKNILLKAIPQEIKIINDLLNLSIEKDLIPINPAAHYTMGGILTNVSCETSLKNLYACGESAQTNIHGANRLGGNSLLEIITFGKLSGKKAFESIDKNNLKNENIKEESNLEYIEDLLSKTKKDSIYKIKRDIGENLFKYAGIFKNEEDLIKLQDKIKLWEERYNNTGIEDKSKIYNKNLIDYIELGNIITIAKIVVQSSINRRESRGSHYRTDYKDTKKEFEKISIVKKENDKIVYTFEKIS